MKLTTLFSAILLAATADAGLIDYLRARAAGNHLVRRAPPAPIVTKPATARPPPVTTTPASARQRPTTTSARPATITTTTRLPTTSSAMAQPAASVAFASPYTPVVAARNTRQVFAHFMIGNTFGQGLNWFQQEIQIAQSMGIDGFILNVGFEDWQPARVATMYQAASNLGFKVFISLDMSVIYSFTPEQLANTFIVPFANSPAQYKMGGRSYLTTFTGENYSSGQQTEPARLWLYFKNYLLSKNIGIFFVPVFTGRGATVQGWDALDGASTWEMWTKTTDALNYYMYLRDNASPSTSVRYGTLGNDPFSYYSGKVHMAGVSPLFFTHYGSKNFIFRDDFLYNARWQNIITAMPDMVQIVSWNDFGESHYIGSLDPTVGDYYQEGSSSARDWTLTPNMNHQALGPITQYFIQTYKNGSPPAQLISRVFFSYRPHSMNAVATGDSLPKPACGQPGNTPAEGCALADNIYITVLAKSSDLPFSFSLTSGSKVQSFTVNTAGLSQLTFTNFQEGTPFITLPNGQILSGPGSISNTITKYNYNHYMATTVFSPSSPP